MMELLEFYTGILGSIGWEVNANGKVVGFKGPIELGNKQLVLPTTERLRNPDWDNEIAFHPMSENVMRGESAVLHELRQQMQFKLNFTAATIIQELGELAVDIDRQKTLTTKQKEYLTLVPDFDAKTVKQMDSLLDRINPNEPEKIIGLFVKRSGELGNNKYKRVASVFSPLRNEAGKKDRTIFGVKFRKCDYDPFFNMFDFILPEINDHKYSFGSNSMVAPSFHALLHAYLQIAKRLNVVLRKFQKVWGEDFEELLLDVSFEEDAKDLDKYKGLIPNLRGNEGAVNPEESEDADTVGAGDTTTAAPERKKKLNWNDKQEQMREEGRKMTFQEKVNQSVPQQAAPTSGFGRTQPTTSTVAEQPTKKRFQDMVAPQPQNRFGGGGGFGQQQQPVRQSTPYHTNNWGQQQGGFNQGGWGNQGNQFNRGNQGGWGNQGGFGRQGGW